MKSWKDRYITIDGIETHYLEAGEGFNDEVLLLIHGGGMTSCAELNYGNVMQPLSRWLRVIALDVVGFGETSSGDAKHFTAQAQGDFIIRFMEELDIRAHVGGNSHGGWLVQYVAHEAPERVRKIVIINSLNGTQPIPPPPEGLKYIFGPQGHPHEIPTLESVRRDLLKLFVNPSIVTNERVMRTYEIASRNYAYARARAEAVHSSTESINKDLEYRGRHISEYAELLDSDVMLSWSRENRGSTPADVLPFLKRLKRGEMHVFLNAGHHVMTEYPERWSEVVTSFLLTSKSRT